MSFVSIKNWAEETCPGRHNRCASKTIEEGLIKGFSKASAKKNSDAYKSLSQSIDHNGWINGDSLVGFKCGENRYELLSGNLRREVVIEKVNNGKLPAYPEIKLYDFSDEINPKTGEYYTFEEAEELYNIINHNPARKHTTADHIDTECLKGNIIAKMIRETSENYSISLTHACDIVINKSGSSRGNQIVDWLHDPNTSINPNAEHFASFIDVFSHKFKENNPDSLADFKSGYFFPAVYELYKASDKCGVRDEFCTIMEDCASMKKPSFAINFNMPHYVQSKIESSIYNFIAFTMKTSDGRYIKHKDIYDKLMNAWEKSNFMNVMSMYTADIDRVKKSPKIDMDKIIELKKVD